MVILIARTKVVPEADEILFIHPSTVISLNLYPEEKNRGPLKTPLRLISECYLGITQRMKKVLSQVNAGNWSYGLLCP